ncbi:hypothetical protein QBC34DRAFT_435620 [Podospora aff. communis PSN243]|uniref:RBR-type E3 ubiquitin transferase n=1 Tax=Podospora aff. communis PSN243 TaxID=3040156 RepID=A0AAV9H089_9PEZI|nr:hypothetical protein QBC34DRAFT_435620 [Podospora aff. communis PSN243]
MASSDYDNSDDPRDIELSSLTAIYPEIQRVRPDDRHTIALDIPVTPSKAVVVFFPAPEAQENAGATTNGIHGANTGQVDSHELAHLPPLHLEVAFGPEYPADQPPKVTLSTTPPWLPAEILRKLEDDAPRLWEEMGRDMVGFTYIDHVQQSAEGVFGLVGGGGGLEVDPKHKIAILDYDIKARQAAFDKETFECGVCLDPKKGAVCHRMLDCGHVFCVECLKDCYNKAIEEGDLAAVRCLEPSCAKEREKAGDSSKKRKKPRTYISPSELLQIPLESAMVKRYVTLKYKNELESDKNTIYCPRSWCNGAARSKKHKKPEGLELAEASDDEDEPEESNVGPDGKPKPFEAKDRLSICEDCSFAFCSRCLQSWHGEFFLCIPPSKKEELTAEEKASAEYIRLHSTPCPTCAVPAQKTHGCNHMICFRCNTHFCYLCSAWLDPMNPYRHFNVQPNGKVTSCYNRLWELEGGDGEGVGYGFDEGFRGDAPLVEVEEVEAEAEAEDGDLDQLIRGDEPAPQAPEPPPEEAPPRGGLVAGQVDIAREGEEQAEEVMAMPRDTRLFNRHEEEINTAQVVTRGMVGEEDAVKPLAAEGVELVIELQGHEGEEEALTGKITSEIRRARGDDVDVDGGGLDAAQQAWIRQFVQLALNDEEDGEEGIGIGLLV